MRWSQAFGRLASASAERRLRRPRSVLVIRPNPGTLGYGTKLRMRVNDFTRNCEEQLGAGTLEVADIQTQLLAPASSALGDPRDLPPTPDLGGEPPRANTTTA